MDESVVKALKSFSTYSAGNFDVWSLAGDAKASCRQHIMSELLGAKVPRAKCGVTAIREEFQRRLGATGDTIAAREGDFIKKARAVLAGKEPLVDVKLSAPLEQTVSRKSPRKPKNDPATLKVIELLEQQNALLRQQLKGGR